MMMLVLGVALWWAAHLFKRVAPTARARMGDGGKGLVTLALLVSVVLMYFGYDPGAGPFWWGRSAALVGINNLLMVAALFLFVADGMRAPVVARMRHPQLTGFKLWAAAHLLVNGDLPSVILFGGLLAWAVVEVIVINRSQRDWTPKPARPGGNPKAIAGTIFAVVAIMMVHNWLGVQPWGA
ncbi:MAG: NnrU family protein [Paracoccaceae bacterium]